VTVGAALALVVDILMLSAGHAGLTRQAGSLGTFYDVQGHAFLHGRLDVDPSVVSIEGFLIGGKTYIYFGPVPALVRLPVLLFTHHLDGRLTQLSMLLGIAVMLAAAGQLHWRIRELVRPGAPVTRTELVAAALMQFALGAGSVVLFLTSWLSVYNETELWGAVFTVAAVSAVVGVIAEPSARRIAWAGLLTVLAVHSRVSVGLGPVVALLILASAVAVPRLAALGPARLVAPRGRTVALLVAAALVPVASYAVLNEAKFGQAFGIPFDRQLNTKLSPIQQETLARNGGGLFGAKFVPTTVLQAARPDAIGVARGFPFLSLPSWHPHVVGNVMFDKLQRSLSAPTSMVLFCVLTLIGLAAVVRRRLLSLVGVLAGTAFGFAPALAIAFVTTRYLADLLPFLVVGALVGLQALLASPARRVQRALVPLVALGALAGLAVNGSVGLLVQRLIGSASDTQRASFVRAQDDVDRFLGRSPTGIAAGATLPPPGNAGRPGDLFVVDRCAALYVRDQDDDWAPVERTERGGLHRLSVRFPASTGGASEALLTVGTGARRVAVSARGGSGRFAFALRVGGRVVAGSPPASVATGRPVGVVLSFDNTYRASFAALSVDGRNRATASAQLVPGAPSRVGSDPADPGLRPFSGSVRRVATGAPVCRQVAGRAGLLGRAG
jgi:hypothetical protein